MASGSTESSDQVEWLPTAELRFDTRNPRLCEFQLGNKASDAEVISVLWDAMDVQPLIVVKEGETDCNIVIEGNRRLAAVKLLLDPSLHPDANVEEASSDLSNSLKKLPAIITTREESWRYLGFKHVNGPAKWGSYAKARYIADVHDNYGVPLDDIARQIGDTHKTVQRLFHGLMVINQAEAEGVYLLEDRAKKHFSFSHLYTGLQYPGFRNFLSLRAESEESSNPVPPARRKELGELCKWLYGSREEQLEPVVVSQNPDLKKLDDVLADVEALAALRDGETLDVAHELSRAADRVFEEALLSAKRSLQKARGYVSEAYRGEEDLLRIARVVATTADHLHDEMDRIQRDRRRQRRVEDEA